VNDIVVTSLSKSYGAIRALEDLSFTVEESSMYGFIGPDGAGKTTFMRIAACLLAPGSGQVAIHAFETRKNAADIKRIIGYMPQHFSQYADLTVGENLAFFADLFGVRGPERKERIGRLLEFSRLEKFLKRPAGQLSGGMKRKLALSCTLVHTPRVLLLDEPTTGVDPVSRREFWEILAEVKRGGTTILVSTPYMDEASRCDRVGFIMNGRLIREGIPAELPSTYAGEIVSAVAPDIVRKTRKAAFPEMVTGVMVFGDRLHLTVENAEQAIPVLKPFLEGLGVISPVLERVPPSMEDIFVESMAHVA
jgi:ABC-2 type transport system ATP-binding protein